MTLDADPSPARTAGRAQLLGRDAPRRGRVARLAAALPVPCTVLHRREDAPAVLTRLYSEAVRGREAVHVVQLTTPRGRDVGVELATAGWLVGDTPAYRDVTFGPALDAPASPAVYGLRTPRVDGAAVRVLRAATAAVIVVDASRASERVLADAAGVLDGLGVPLTGLVVHEGRIPRAGGGPLPVPVARPDPG